jgi:hypothetical protein
MIDSEQRRSSQQIALVVGVTLVAAWLRFVELGGKSLWFDEALFFWATQGDFDQVVKLNESVRASPPIYAFIIHVWSGLGDTEWWLRLPAWIAGVASVPMSYALARHFVPPGAALFSAVLVATSVRHLQFSQQVSEYGLAYLAATALLLAFARYRARPDRSRAITLAALTAISPLVHYGLGILVGALVLAYLIDVFADPSRRRPPASFAIVLIPMLAVGLVAWFALGVGSVVLLQDGPGSDDYLSRAYWDGSLVSLGRLAVGSTLDVFDYAHSVGGVVLVLCAAGIANIPRHRGEQWVTLVLLIALGATFTAALAGVYPYAGKRHVFFLLPLIYLVAATGVARLERIEPAPERRVLIGALVFLVSVSGLYDSIRFLRSDAPENMRPVAAVLRADRETTDAVYIYSPAVPAAHYYLSQQDAALRQELGARIGEWLPRLLPLELGPDDDPAAPNPTDADRAPLRFAPCPGGDCRRVPILGHDTLYTELERLDAALERAERSWLLFSHCRVDDCRNLLTRAARCAELEPVAEAAEVSLYLATPIPGCPSEAQPAQASSAEARRAIP